MRLLPGLKRSLIWRKNKDCRNKDAGLRLEEMIVRNSKNTWNVLARACTHQQLIHMAGAGDCGDSQIEPRPSTLTDRSWIKEPGGAHFIFWLLNKLLWKPWPNYRWFMVTYPVISWWFSAMLDYQRVYMLRFTITKKCYHNLSHLIPENMSRFHQQCRHSWYNRVNQLDGVFVLSIIFC